LVQEIYKFLIFNIFNISSLNGNTITITITNVYRVAQKIKPLPNYQKIVVRIGVLYMSMEFGFKFG